MLTTKIQRYAKRIGKNSPTMRHLQETLSITHLKHSLIEGKTIKNNAS